MAIKYQSGLMNCKYYQFFKGQKYVIYEVEFPQTYGLTSTKVSVDTGKFVPGSYRVNPYSVYREKALSGPGRVQTSRFSGTAPNTTVSYYEIAWENHGPIAAGLLTAVKSFSWNGETRLRDKAMAKAYGKVGSAAYAQGENIGELRQTLEGISNPLAELRKFLLKGENLSKLYNLLRAGSAASGTWLEIRYGLLPIYRSIIDIAEALQEKKKAMNLSVIRTANSYQTVEESYRLPPVNFGYLWNIAPLSGFQGQGRILIKAASNASVQYRYTEVPDAGDRWGVTLPYLPETAWQLANKSFVWDWFLGIGDWIESWRITPNIYILGDTSGFKIERSLVDAKLAYTDYTGKQESIGLECEISSETYNRTVNYGIPSTPVFHGLENLSTDKIVDLLAMTFQGIMAIVKPYSQITVRNRN